MASPATRATRCPSPLIRLLLLWSALGAMGVYCTLRLPGEVVPLRYRLDIVPDIESNFSFYGEVWMELRAEAVSEVITIHRGRGLNVDSAESTLHLLTEDEGRKEENDVANESLERNVTIVGENEGPGADMVELLLEEALVPQRRYLLHLAFNAALADDLTGFYRVSFKEGNVTRWMASTVFEPTEARRAFPCFDEPALKARFQVNVARPRRFVTLSNMPLRESAPMESSPGWVWDRYEQSPLMSPYLAAWAVGPLASRATNTSSGRPFRVWGRKSALRDADYALRVGPHLQKALREYVGVDEPMPKTDFLAMPSFVSDALENWGLVSFGERFLLVPAGASSAASRSGFIVAHELAHSWFGNLVTLEWWDAIWLNEGFATFFGALAQEAVEPQRQVAATTAVRAFREVFSIDALRSSHALVVNATTAQDLYQIFDSITYFKGYYMLRMLNHTLGETTFRAAVSRYVRRNRLSSVREEQLWEAMAEQAAADGVQLPLEGDVAEIMYAWTRRPGYPLLTIHKQDEDGTVLVTQERFLRSPGDILNGREESDSAEAGDDHQEGWWVPLTLTWAGGPMDWQATRPFAWLDPSNHTTSLQIPADLDQESWLLANVHAAGLYRVNYESRNWRLLAAALRRNASAVPVLNRALLLDDALDLARAGRLPYARALDVTRYLRRENELPPWLAALGGLDYVRRMLPASTDVGAAFQRFVLRLLTPPLQRLGLWPRAGEPTPDALTRKLLARWACYLGQTHCVQSSLQRFARWRASPSGNAIPADLRPVVLCAAVEHGTRGDWEFLWERLKNATSTGQRAGVISSLGCSKDPEILERFLYLSIKKDSPIKKQQSAVVFETVAKNPVGHAVAKDFLIQNIDQISQESSPFHISQLLQSLAYRMNTVEELEDLELLKQMHGKSLRMASRTLRQVYETVRFNIVWLRLHKAGIANWLRRSEHRSGADDQSDHDDLDHDDETTTQETSLPETTTFPETL